MKPEEKVVELFVAVDARDWDKVLLCFEDLVLLDYSSMNGIPPAVLRAEEIVQSWRSALPLFKATHHQLGNMLSNINGREASVLCNGTATHYLEHKDSNVWTIVGSYKCGLKETDGGWRIVRMKFKLKYLGIHEDVVRIQ